MEKMDCCEGKSKAGEEVTRMDVEKELKLIDYKYP